MAFCESSKWNPEGGPRQYSSPLLELAVCATLAMVWFLAKCTRKILGTGRPNRVIVPMRKSDPHRKYDFQILS